jgi:ABC-type enterobactin transport system permease subunit
VAKENYRKERPWAREERDAAAKVVGTAVRGAVAVGIVTAIAATTAAAAAAKETGTVGLAAPSRSTRRNARRDRRSGRPSATRNGSRSASGARSVVKTAEAETDPAGIVPVGARPGREA